MAYTTICYGSGRGEIKNEERAIGELRKRNNLWNRLVEVEQEYVKIREAKISSLEPSDAVPRKDVLKRLDVKDALFILNQDRWKAVNEACRNSGLYWANYSEVAKDYESARKRDTLRFHRWDGTGKLTVHYQNGIDPKDVFSETERRFQIDPGKETQARIRIDTEGKSPVWFEIPIVVHRPLPDLLSTIRDVSFVRECLWHDYRWKVTITMSVPDVERLSAENKSATITVGWKQTDQGILIAHTDDEDLYLPQRWLDSLRECDRLRIHSFAHDARHEAHLRDQLYAQRRDMYRNYARRLCSRYTEIHVNHIGLGWMKEENNGGSWNMNAAALSYFYDILENCAKNTGTKLVMHSRKGGN